MEPALAIVFLSVMFLGWLSNRPARAKAKASLGYLHNQLDDAEVLILEGSLEPAARVLNELGPALKRLRGPDGCRMRGWHRLVCAELVARGGGREEVRAPLEDALRELTGAPEGDLRSDLETRAMASLGFLAAPDDADRFYLDHGERALRRANQTRRPDALLQLVWLACRLGDLHRSRGDWDRAKACLELGIRTAERLELSATDGSWSRRARELFWSHARASASSAATELGEVCSSLGDREAGIGWCDRAITMLVGAELPVARLAQARALLARGMQETPEALGDIAPRLAFLERAVAAGLASGLAPGSATAAEADIAIGMMFSSMGAMDRAATHLRRVQHHLRDPRDPAAAAFVTQAALMLGMTMRDGGNREGAMEALRAALDAGQHAPHPDARQLAAIAAHQLHGLLLDQDQLDEARAILEAIEAIVPTLNAEVRISFSAMAARSRAYQALNEGRTEEARETLQRAEAVASASGAPPWGVIRAIAMDLGVLSLSTGKPSGAVEDFRRALAFPAVTRPSGEEQAERADLRWKLAQALLEVDRRPEAQVELERAYEQGRDSGCAQGREVAALAAMLRGDLTEDAPKQRRELYENAVRLARLSGRPRSAEIAEALGARLREFAE